jgi:prepilin-type N-terminal cleavage/methylation domain-containing protein
MVAALGARTVRGKPGAGAVMRKRPVLGFSMIETVAALAVFSVGASIVFSWMSQTSQTLNRVAIAQERNAAQLRALDYLRTIDLARAPAGEQNLGPLQLRWRSESLLAARPALSLNATPDAYDLSMRRVRAELAGSPNLEGYSFEVDLPAYELKRARDGMSLFR